MLSDIVKDIGAIQFEIATYEWSPRFKVDALRILTYMEELEDKVSGFSKALPQSIEIQKKTVLAFGVDFSWLYYELYGEALGIDRDAIRRILRHIDCIEHKLWLFYEGLLAQEEITLAEAALAAAVARLEAARANTGHLTASEKQDAAEGIKGSLQMEGAWFGGTEIKAGHEDPTVWSPERPKRSWSRPDEVRALRYKRSTMFERAKGVSSLDSFFTTEARDLRTIVQASLPNAQPENPYAATMRAAVRAEEMVAAIQEYRSQLAPAS